jgi:hypothetical protein
LAILKTDILLDCVVTSWFVSTLLITPWHGGIQPFTECLVCTLEVVLEEEGFRWIKKMDPCETRNQLLNEWKEATTLYDGLVASIVAHIGVMKKEDFDRLMETVRIADRFADRTRKNFELHVENHICCGQAANSSAQPMKRRKSSASAM